MRPPGSFFLDVYTHRQKDTIRYFSITNISFLWLTLTGMIPWRHLMSASQPVDDQWPCMRGLCGHGNFGFYVLLTIYEFSDGTTNDNVHSSTAKWRQNVPSPVVEVCTGAAAMPGRALLPTGQWIYYWPSRRNYFETRFAKLAEVPSAQHEGWSQNFANSFKIISSGKVSKIFPACRASWRDKAYLCVHFIS